MYKSQYNYKATYPSTLSFSSNEIFIELPGARSDKNWYFVTNIKGNSGFVPRNYVEALDFRLDDQEKHLRSILENLNTNTTISQSEKGETLASIEKLRKLTPSQSSSTELNQSSSPNPELIPILGLNNNKDSMSTPGSPSNMKTTGSRESLISVRSSKKRAAPQPPRSRGDHNSPRASPRPPSTGLPEDPSEHAQEDSESNNSLNSSLQIPGDGERFQHQTSFSSVSTDSAVVDLVTVTYSHPQESCRSQALDLIEQMRTKTNLSHGSSTLLLQQILQELVRTRKDLNVLVPSLVAELKGELFNDDLEIVASSDYNQLTDILDQLAKVKDDDEQRNWMLHQDEDTILTNLRTAQTTFRNAKLEISKKVICRYKYYYVLCLTEYYQMETRWSIRCEIIQTIIIMASIDPGVISVLLSSVLPLELVQDMLENMEDVERLKNTAILLTIIFSQGEQLPVHYLEQLGGSFVDLLLLGVENPPSSDVEVIPDAFMGVIASYNLQFQDLNSNILLERLAEAASAKVFTEKLLLLLNREEDPAQLLGESSDINSVHKLILDIFSSETCWKHFYLNDLMVLIDIIVRQLCDLGPGVHRYTYLEMSHLVLSRSDYEEHQHRLSDLQVCLQRILGEEGQSVDKEKTEEICKAFSCFNIDV